MADDAIRKELDALKADIAQLRGDIVGLTHAVKGAASEKMASTKAHTEEQLRGAWQDIEHRLEDLLAQSKAAYNKAEQKVSEHPVGSVLTAFGLGFIIAKLIDMRGRH
ncbi:MAG: hypothetical protein AB1810_10815 [Pseudomonadota bacterium]